MNINEPFNVHWERSEEECVHACAIKNEINKSSEIIYDWHLVINFN